MTNWTTDHLGWPQATLPVKSKGITIGGVQVTFLSGGRAYACAESDGREGTSTITWKGSQWYASVTLFAATGWSEDNPDDPEAAYHLHQFADVTASRMGVYGKTIAPTYRAAIVAGIREAVTGYVAEHPEVLTAATRNQLERDLASTRKGEEAALQAWRAARTEVMRIETELDEIAAQAAGSEGR